MKKCRLIFVITLASEVRALLRNYNFDKFLLDLLLG